MVGLEALHLINDDGVYYLLVVVSPYLHHERHKEQATDSTVACVLNLVCAL
jgi:hypothetical protein